MSCKFPNSSTNMIMYPTTKIMCSNYACNKIAPTLSIDLSKSWTTSSVVINEISKPAEMLGRASYRDPALYWHDSAKSLLLFGGDDYADQTPYEDPRSLWSFTPDNGDGSWAITTLQSKDFRWTRRPAGANTLSGGVVVGGFNSNFAPQTIFSNMTIIGNTGSITRNLDIGPFEMGGAAYVKAQFIPNFGTGQGIIVYIGGLSQPGGADTKSLYPMSSIQMYDIGSKQWYTQTAGGDVPSGRWFHCMTGAQATGNRSYEM